MLLQLIEAPFGLLLLVLGTGRCYAQEWRQSEEVAGLGGKLESPDHPTNTKTPRGRPDLATGGKVA